jgi:hypothetical protein
METLAIGEDGIPDGERRGVFEARNGEVKLPLANAGINSMPAIVVAALPSRLKPSIMFVRDLMFRWFCSIRLLRYFEDRTFVSSGSRPSAFIWSDRQRSRSMVTLLRTGAADGHASGCSRAGYHRAHQCAEVRLSLCETMRKQAALATPAVQRFVDQSVTLLQGPQPFFQRSVFRMLCPEPDLRFGRLHRSSIS